MTKQPEKSTHYFASTCASWGVGQTRAEAMANAARGAGSDVIKANVKPHGGLYCWTCRVEAPESAEYQISYYAPQDVECTRVQEFNLQNTKGHALPIDHEDAS